MSSVLLVDDDPAALCALSAQLSELGHEVCTAGAPEQAITLVEDGFSPDVAVLEVSLPDMTGFELAQILHDCPPTRRLPVLFMSESIASPATFTDDGVTAKYVNKHDVDTVLPTAIPELAAGAALSR